MPITYDLNGGRGAISDKDRKYYEDAGVPVAAPDGKVFLGKWSSTSGRNGGSGHSSGKDSSGAAEEEPGLRGPGMHRIYPSISPVWWAACCFSLLTSCSGKNVEEKTGNLPGNRINIMKKADSMKLPAFFWILVFGKAELSFASLLVLPFQDDGCSTHGWPVRCRAECCGICCVPFFCTSGEQAGIMQGSSRGKCTPKQAEEKNAPPEHFPGRKEENVDLDI